MKKILALCAVASIGFGAVSEYELRANEEIFKKGFEAGLKALEFQGQNDGYAPKSFKIKKEYYLTADITKMPYSEAIFLQNIANKEGFETKISKNVLYFGDFEREVDAKEAAKELKDRFQVTAKISRNANGNAEIITYPQLWNDFYREIITTWTAQGFAVRTELLCPKNTVGFAKPAAKPAAPKKPAPQKLFSLKNDKAMSYEAKNSDEKSKSFVEIDLAPNKSYEYGKTIKTKEGESFVKVKDKNIYFSDRDVVMK